jgi:hypothetical protein
MPAQGNFKKGTNQFMRMGHTTSRANGNEIGIDAIGPQAEAAKEVKP